MTEPVQEPRRDGAIEAAGYELIRRVAAGGMGEIWQARTKETGELVAIKRVLLAATGAALQSLSARLLREAQATAKIDHPSVVRFLDAGSDDNGQPFIVLEWLEGKSLAELLVEGDLDLPTTLDFVGQALEGLAACHEAGIVHRDIKPENLFVYESPEGKRIKLLDLGIALVESRETRLTQVGSILGTIHYLSPEQARGSLDVDHRADIYAMGVLLYQMCTGRLPFNADAPVAILIKIITETPIHPKTYRPELPEWLDDLIWRALQRAPSDRFDSAKAMRAALLKSPSTFSLRPVPHLPLHMKTLVGDAKTINEQVLLDPRRSAEFRMVSLLFVDCAGQPGLAAVAERIIEQAGGVAQRLIGDLCIGLFGVERRRGDEPLHSVMSGLAIAKEASEPVRILAATIHVEVDEGLQLQSQELERAIDSLESLPPGRVILDRPTRELTRSNVQVEEVGAHFAALADGDTSGDTQGAHHKQRVQTPLIGRDEEVAMLKVAFGQAVEDEECRVAFVIGPSGIGKTRLVSEVAAQLRETATTFFSARVDSTLTSSPGGALADAIGRAAGIGPQQSVEEKLEALRELLGQWNVDEEEVLFLASAMGIEQVSSATLQAARSDPRLMQERLASSLEEVLRKASEAGVVVVWLDDLQWERDTVVELYGRIFERLEDCPVFFVASAWEEFFEKHDSLLADLEPTKVALGPMRKRSCRKLSAALLGGKVTSELGEGIREWSHGNPYLVEEFVAWLVTHDAVVQDATGWRFAANPKDLGLPVALEAAVQERIDRLEPARKEMLKTGSIFGEAFWNAGLGALWPDAPAEQLPELEKSDFLEKQTESRFAGEEEWAFRSRAVQGVAYTMVPQARREVLHRSAARWLEEHGEVDALVLARHFERAGELSRAQDWYAKAGARALADFDSQAAVEYLGKSLGAGVGDADRVERMTQLVDALILTAQYDDALVQAEELLQDELVKAQPERHARVLWLQGRTLRALSRTPEAVESLSQAFKLVADKPPAELHLDIDWALFWALWITADRTQAEVVSERMRTVASALGRADRQSEAELAGAMLHVVGGDLGVAVELANAATAHAREVRHVLREIDSLLLSGSLSTMVGDFARGGAALIAAGELAARLRARYSQCGAEEALGYLAYTCGDRDAALGHYQAAAELGEALGSPAQIATAHSGHARARLLEPHTDEDVAFAKELATKAFIAVQGKADSTVLRARLALTEAYLAAHDKSAAWREATELLALLDQIGGEEFEVEVLLAIAAAAKQAGQNATSAQTRAAQHVRQSADRIADASMRASFLAVPHNARALSLI